MYGVSWAQASASQQEKELEEERRRQKEVLDEQRRRIDNLEGIMEKRQSAMTAANEEVSVGLPLLKVFTERDRFPTLGTRGKAGY